MVPLQKFGYFFSKGLPPVLFITYFWQTRLNIFPGYEIFDYHVWFLYLSDILIFLILIGETLVQPRWLVDQLGILKWWGVSCVGLILFMALGLGWAVKPSVAIYSIIKLIWFLVFAVWIKKYLQTYPIKRIVILLSIGLLPLVIVGGTEILRGESLGLQLIGEWDFSLDTPGIAKTYLLGYKILRPYATFPHPNVFGGVMAIFAMIWMTEVVNEFKRAYRRRRVVLLTIFLVFFLGTLVSLSRSAWVGFLVGLASLYFPTNFKNFQILRRFSWSIFMVILLVVILIFSVFVRAQALFSWDHLSLLRREGLNEVALRIWWNNPWFGVGVNQFILFVEKYWSVPNVFLVTQPVHNVFLLVLAEMGVIGLGLWTLVVTGPFLFFSKHMDARIRAVWLLMGAIAMVDHYWWTLQSGRLSLFLTLGLTLATIRVHNVRR